MLFSKLCRGARPRSHRLRFESLEMRTLMSATPIQTIPDEMSTEPVAAEVQTDTALSELEDRVGPLTWEENQMLVGDPIASEESSYGGDPYGGDPYGGNTTPTTTGIDDVTIDEDGTFTPVDWSNYFDDAEDGSSLTYEEVGNTDDSVATSYGGSSNLGILLSPDAHGTTDITIRATDSGGLWVESTFTVTVTPVNDAPVISDFVCFNAMEDDWTFSGTVTDVDDDVEGMVIEFGGALSGLGLSATVQSDGTFQTTKELLGVLYGTAMAQTADDNGAVSNLAQYFI